MNPSPMLWYFADPMCSWCWGFSPTINAIREGYADHLQCQLVLGGLRPGTTAPGMRAEILHHWHEVQRRSGQPFDFDGALPEGFVYDTEPASRATVTVGELNPLAVFPYFKSVQSAFYAEGKDVTRTETLVALAEQHQVPPARFRERFESADIKHETVAHFEHARRSGITGFPAAVLQNESGVTLLTYGYRPFEELKPILDTWLAGES